MSDNHEIPFDAFPAFFRSINDGRNPFRWQVRLAEQVCTGKWPDYIKLPTASGKTSCLDIAVFAMAFQACRRERTKQAMEAPRRIFFVVDRRIIVSEAFDRALKISRFLKRSLNIDSELRSDERLSFEHIADADRTVLVNVAGWLKHLAGNTHAPPLDCYELRGGIYRNDAWVRSLLQPTIVTSTVDQVGSRLLFRGYGVSDHNLAIHAALTANDALILLDEAHCSNAFSQTMKSIARYRDAGLKEGEQPRWAEQSVRTPLMFVEMTATPPQDAKHDTVLQLDDGDYAADPVLNERHGCAKMIRLATSAAKGATQNSTLAKHLVEHAESLAKGGDEQAPCRRIAIVVNRVACARAVHALLCDAKKGHGDRVELMIGRMRPFDRDRLTRTLQQRFKSGANETLSEPHFVVATQCLEIGADFDFDGMVTQCASLDALRQRFGRLNRLGQSEHSRGIIVMAEGDKAPRRPDPIYGESLPATWEWLQLISINGQVDFGIKALDQVLIKASRETPAAVRQLSPKPEDAPVLMPAHLDLLSQTGPRPAIEPNIAAYLHGPNRGIPEVRICWRADLPEFIESQTASSNHSLSQWEEACQQTLVLCPPSSAELLSVPLPQFKAWLKGEESDDFSDLLGEQQEDADTDRDSVTKQQSGSYDQTAHRRGVIWKSPQCVFLDGSKDRSDKLFPEAIIVLPATAGGWSVLGHIPKAPADPDQTSKGKQDGTNTIERRCELARIDIASEAFKRSHNREILRVHRSLMTSSMDNAALTGLWKFVSPDTPHSWQHKALSQYEEDDDATCESDSSPTEAILTEGEHQSSKLRHIRELLAGKSPKHVTMVRYPQLFDGRKESRDFGMVILGPLQIQPASLPRASFGDDFDEHNLEASERLPLTSHLADVAAETQRVVRNINLEASLADALIAAAERHDLGKADLRFQAMLLGSSLDLASMQPTLWAKSTRGAESRRVTLDHSSSTHEADQLPRGFRHEMLSLQLAELLRDDLDDSTRDVMLHAIAAHHGHARPFAPVVEDTEPLQIDLTNLFPSENSGFNLTLSSSERAEWQAHCLNSGISERFWRLNRRFGWWGLAWIESVLRLADWVASAQPDRRPQSVVYKVNNGRIRTTRRKICEIPLVGISGTNPLGFLTAIGVLRTATCAMPEADVRMSWAVSGTWHPVLQLCRDLTAPDLTNLLHEALAGRHLDDHFLLLGKNTNVARDEFRRVVLRVLESASASSRTSIDFFAAFGSDALVSVDDSESIQDTALRTMAGAGHQHFLETMRNLIAACQPSHLEKTLFRTWTYDDPTQTLSLRFDPFDDNRYALRWRNPSGDPDRKTSGSMLGANRLSIEAIPLFVTAPGVKRLQTAAFTGYRSDDTFMHWPIWTKPITLEVVQSLLVSKDLVASPINAPSMQARGVVAVLRSQRITVGKVRNFTAGRPNWVSRGNVIAIDRS